MKFIAYILLITAFILNPLETLGAQEKDVIRVGLSNSNFSNYEFNSATIITSAQSTIHVMDSGAQIKDIPANTEINVQMKNTEFFITINNKELAKNAKGPIVIVSKEKLGVKNLNRKGNPAYYRGMIELKTAYPENRGKFNIINVLDAQTYLKGVVPNEMPVSFGLNALKAQAVAARNYANRPQNAYKNYDICDSTACQVYYGANSENPLSDRAVDETQGIFALYNKEPILALYSSTGGGITEDYERVYGTGNIQNIIYSNSKPYLKSVKDNNSLKTPKSEEELKEFYSNNIPSFDVKSPKHRWKVTFDRFELEEILSKTLFEQSLKGLVYPAFGVNDKVFGIEDIRVLKRGESGKGLEVEIRAVSGTWHVKKELGIRRVFKKGKSILWSGNFVIEKINPKSEENIEDNSKNSDKISLEKISEKEEFKQTKEAKTPENTLLDAEKSDGKALLENKTGENKDQETIFSFSKKEKTVENKAPSANEPKIEAIKEKEEIKKIYKNALGIPLPEAFTFIGAGFGHGVGMSQYGAGYLSAQGVDYSEILKHYYSGIALGTMPKTVSYNNYNQDYAINIYYDGQKAHRSAMLPSSISSNPLKEELTELFNASNAPVKYVLNINNEKKPAELEFYVNDFHFTPDMKGFYGKILKMDITKYLKKGKNTIKFTPLKATDKEKTVTFWVEIEK